ncbi:multidrug ABC transporter ATP-binding protein [Haloferula helveola]|uniref:Multidrug ABC transporter ATP-binding protein n=1 Tax=Haloferula helveola TaxID=490095 RepID=A0ABN6H7I8_9BACT|nr:multidrug ABC transporter ATP-binding protein [Haloferula helveola]
MSFLRRLSNHLGKATLVVVLGISGTALVLVLPAVARHFTDVVIGENRPDLVLPTALVGLAAIALRQILLALRSLSSQWLEAKVVHELRVELFDKLQRQPIRWFDRNRSGEVMSRVSTDVPAMQRMLVESIDIAFPALLQFLVVLAALFWHDWRLALVTIAPLPLIGLVSWRHSLVAEPQWRESSEATAALHALLHDSLSGIRQIKAYTGEPESFDRFETASLTSRRKYMRVMRSQSLVWPAISILAEAGIIAMVAYGSWRVLAGEIEAGTLFYFLFAWGFLFEPISKINPFTQTVNRGRASAKRVAEILDRPDEAGLVEGIRPDSVRGDLRFEGVSFSYDPESPAVSGIDLHASPGQTIALVGPTGAGKSTLLNLIARFYEPDQGRILLDGRPLSELSKEWLRDHLGYVTQESFLFNASLRDNLLLAKKDATDEEIWTALDAANASGFVRQLPDQLDTLAGERGTRFSGGERQRLSIARAILRNPPILLLDEATSALDNKTERLVQEAMERLRSKRTCFVIAHRLSTIESADQILVLKDGRIAESGRHAELVERRGEYFRLQVGQAD